jgi:hypothetical protein
MPLLPMPKDVIDTSLNANQAEKITIFVDILSEDFIDTGSYQFVMGLRYFVDTPGT